MNILDKIRNILVSDITGGRKFYNQYLFVPIDNNGNRNRQILFKNNYVSRANNLLKSIRDDREIRPRCLIRSGNSINCQALMSDLNYLKIPYFREYIISLSDKTLGMLRRKLRFRGLTEDVLKKKKKFDYWNKNYWSIDLYLPSVRVFLEADSEFHKKEPELDLVRDDILLEILGIPTIRLWRYSETSQDYAGTLEYLRNSQKTTLVYPDQTYEVAEEIYSKRKYEFDSTKGDTESIKKLLGL